MSKEVLQKAVQIAGGQVALAAGIRSEMPGLKVSQAHIWKWLNRVQAEVPPAEYVIAIAKTVDFEVTPHELRPDIYPHPRDGLPGQLPEPLCEERAG